MELCANVILAGTMQKSYKGLQAGPTQERDNIREERSINKGVNSCRKYFSKNIYFQVEDFTKNQFAAIDTR